MYNKLVKQLLESVKDSDIAKSQKLLSQILDMNKSAVNETIKNNVRQTLFV